MEHYCTFSHVRSSRNVRNRQNKINTENKKNNIKNIVKYNNIAVASVAERWFYGAGRVTGTSCCIYSIVTCTNDR